MLFMLIFAMDLNNNMYAYLEGKFTMKNAAQVYVDINGVGYELNISLNTYAVSGVGASTARMMLSHLKPAEVSKAIVQNNVKLLESVKGIGKKTAERLVLELRDKVTKAVTDLTIPVTAGNRLQQDALNALVSLGISRPQAESAIQKINHTEPDINNLEELIKKALKAI